MLRSNVCRGQLLKIDINTATFWKEKHEKTMIGSVSGALLRRDPAIVLSSPDIHDDFIEVLTPVGRGFVYLGFLAPF